MLLRNEITGKNSIKSLTWGQFKRITGLENRICKGCNAKSLNTFTGRLTHILSEVIRILRAFPSGKFPVDLFFL